MKRSSITIAKSTQDFLPLRDIFLKELNRQFVHYSYHERGWADVFTFHDEGSLAGYGALYGNGAREKRDTVFEFYLTEAYRPAAQEIFGEFLRASKATAIASQTNDVLLASLVKKSATDIKAEAILFEDNRETDLKIPDVIFRKAKDTDKIFEHTLEPVGPYVVEWGSEVVATGGFLLHYNFPFADLFMEVRQDVRGRGLAGFLLQEIKKECYRAGRVPAARCNPDNTASKNALLKAGLKECGHLLKGKVHITKGQKID